MARYALEYSSGTVSRTVGLLRELLVMRWPRAVHMRLSDAQALVLLLALLWGLRLAGRALQVRACMLALAARATAALRWAA